jgi:hypothetical protein
MPELAGSPRLNAMLKNEGNMITFNLFKWPQQPKQKQLMINEWNSASLHNTKITLPRVTLKR